MQAPHFFYRLIRLIPFSSTLAVGLLLFGGVESIANAQTREEVRQQAEARLRQITPEEIDRKLKELGMTPEEATRRAQDFGISLDEFLLRQFPDTTGQYQSLQFDPRLGFQRMTPASKARQDTLGSRALTTQMGKRLEVLGFRGRRGIDSLLQPFGYEIFQYPASTFEPSVNVATPPSYALGAGDELTMSVWGETKLNYKLGVNREGNVVVPDVGPVAASGLTVQQFRDRLVRRMTTIYSGLRGGAANANTFLDVSLGKLKTIQVFVLGEVARPGGYAVSSMSTALHAIFAAGGPTVDGTLRDVHVGRSGDSAASVDLYGYILKGDRSSDHYLQDGDVVFIRPAGTRTAVVGQVVRPAIYELKKGETLGDLITYTGGLRFNAYSERIHIERVVPFDQRKDFDKDVLDFDVRFEKASDLSTSTQLLENGDIVTVFKVGDLPQNRVVISGSVNKPGAFALRPGMRIRDLILIADSLKRSTFSERGTLFRVLPNLRVEIEGFNPGLALDGREQDNILLRNEDSVVVYPDSQFFPQHPVTIKGAVRRPGMYTRNDNMSISDLVVMAGGLTEGATTLGWEISRMDTTQIGVYSRILKVNMDSAYWNNEKNEKSRLEDFDVVFVPTDPKYTAQKSVKLTGYVMFPGSYVIKNEGERLEEIFTRAGGVRKGAYLEGSRLIRKFNDAGLVPLDFKKAIEDPQSRDNVVVYDGDSVHVAYIEDIIYVSGEVYVPSPVLYKENASLGYYIRQAGGYKEEAEEGKTVVFLPGGKKWEGGDILPGSSIFVPKKIEKPDHTLAMIRDLATILASLAAISVALIQVSK